jgi:hypothetical protein
VLGDGRGASSSSSSSSNGSSSTMITVAARHGAAVLEHGPALHLSTQKGMGLVSFSPVHVAP